MQLRSKAIELLQQPQEENGDRRRFKASARPKIVFKLSPLRCFKSDFRKQGIYVYIKNDLSNDACE